MERCWIGLGGNLGDVPQTFAAVAAELQSHPGVCDLQFSPFYRSAPMGVNSGAEFWNAVIGFNTNLDPEALLDRLQQLEARHGRVRNIPWGPRTLDLDVIYFGSQRLRTPRLRVPHPGRICRRFVLDPLCDLATDWVDPEYGITISKLRQRLVQTPRQLSLLGIWDAPAATAVQQQVWQRWPDVVCDRDLSAIDHGLVITTDESAAFGIPALIIPPAATLQNVIQFVLDTATAAFEPPVRVS